MSGVDARLFESIEIMRHLGWQRQSRVEGQFEVWTSPDESHEAILPLDARAGDFIGLMERLQRVVRESDPWRFDNWLREAAVAAEASLETTQWHKETALPPGLIQWGQGEGLHQHAREQLVASAKATVEKRRYHGNRSSFLANSFLSEAYMGVPEAASYVVTALTPREARFYVSKAALKRADASAGRLLDPEVVTGHDILQTYENALTALRHGLDEYAKAPRIEPLLEAVAAGVSFEMTKSLEEIVVGGDTGISIYRGSRGSASVELEFRSSEAPILGKASSALVVDESPRRVSIIGEVTLLKRETGSQDRVVRIDVLAGDPHLNKARIRLTAEQYEKAIEAHRSQSALEVSGVIAREGNLYWMYTADSLAVVEPPEIEQPVRETTASSGRQDGLPGLE